jgi:hypothetical protein
VPAVPFDHNGVGVISKKRKSLIRDLALPDNNAEMLRSLWEV